ncbi:cephalosporin esterase [Irpex rosettiformis]|uniref:Cephalosporin esterase n=1 Tax=Irpex rosettiformis TaxID=378272 RepID=A0ACB8UIR1_9APHY|nr:cephalosporin esterase [Irpex rosettiformis]
MLLVTVLALLSLATSIYASTHYIHPPPSIPPIVDLGYALYQGTFNATANTTDFLGIRYAASPTGVQKADALPTGCPQASFGVNISTPFRSSNKSDNVPRREPAADPEDCLFLNVFVSGSLNSRAKMPVIVWFHGGGYVAESTQGFNGDDLIREGGGGLVVVTMDYRLGVFGFLAGAEVKRKGALNAGLLDQQAALQWVRKNIHLFGGDPNEVTIWGESAGGGSVIQHMIANGGQTRPSLFKGGMSSSLFMPSQYQFDDPISEEIYSEFVRLTGCTHAKDSFDCLTKVDGETLQQANVEINNSGFFGSFVVVPVVDGEFIRSSPTEQLLKGPLNGERLLMMTNTFEGTILVNANFSVEMTVADYVTQLFPKFNAQQIAYATALYTNDTSLETTNDKAIAIMGESILICPTYLVLQSFKGPAFKGEFAVPPGTHVSDVPYYFPNGTAPPFSNPQFDASFAGAFTAFAKSGDPNKHPVSRIMTPEWNTFSQNSTEMLFNRTEDFRPDIRPISTDSDLLKRCE